MTVAVAVPCSMPPPLGLQEDAEKLPFKLPLLRILLRGLNVSKAGDSVPSAGILLDDKGVFDVEENPSTACLGISITNIPFCLFSENDLSSNSLHQSLWRNSVTL